jgi:hypothetical protein
VHYKVVEVSPKTCDDKATNSKLPFGPDDPFSDFLRRQLAQLDMVKNTLGPTLGLQQRLAAMEGPLAHLRTLEKTGILTTAASIRGSELATTMSVAEAVRRSAFPALRDYATSGWMEALQTTARAIGRHEQGILATQKQIGSAAIDWAKIGHVFEVNSATVGALMRATHWSEQVKALNERITPNLDFLRIAAERARTIDALALRATAETIARSTAAVAAEQVLEAHRLIEAIGQADSLERSASLFAALVSLMGALFQRFGENTVKEVSGIGAIKLFELFLVVVALVQWVAPSDMSPDEKKAVAEMKAEVETLQQRVEALLKAHEIANENYVADLPRAELKRMTSIRREPQGKAPVLMRGDTGMLLAIKESRGKWRLIVYRDPLSDQLAEGWVYAPAVQMLDAPIS